MWGKGGESDLRLMKEALLAGREGFVEIEPCFGATDGVRGQCQARMARRVHQQTLFTSGKCCVSL